MQIQRTSGYWYWAEYSTFSISDEVGKYQLTVDGYSGDAGDAMRSAQHAYWNANGMMFSTSDSDNDNLPTNCAVVHGGGSWYNGCVVSCLSKNDNGIWTTGVDSYDVQTSHMLIAVY